MKSRLTPSPAIAISLLALFVALGGTGYAATQLSGGGVVAARAKHKPPNIAKLVKKDVRAYFAAHRAMLTGPRGLTGLTGPPGTAFAYASVNADGTLNAANSKNVTASSLPSVGHYCLQVTGTPHNAVATPSTRTGLIVSDTQGVPYIDLTIFTGCPAGTNLVVVMGQQKGTNVSDWPFYIAIN